MKRSKTITKLMNMPLKCLTFYYSELKIVTTAFSCTSFRDESLIKHNFTLVTKQLLETNVVQFSKRRIQIERVCCEVFIRISLLGWHDLK